MSRRKNKKRIARYKRSRHARRRVCKKVCTVCGNAYPKGVMTPKKYIQHVKRWHTSKVLC